MAQSERSFVLTAVVMVVIECAVGGVLGKAEARIREERQEGRGPGARLLTCPMRTGQEAAPSPCPSGQLRDQYQWSSPSLGGLCGQHPRSRGISWSGEDPEESLGSPPNLYLLQVSCLCATYQSPGV